jgi:hypothetical protein
MIKKIARGLLFTLGCLNLALAAGFFFQTEWATGLWFYPDGRLTYIFIASILAAIAAALIWIAFSEEYEAVPAGALNLFILFGGWSVYLFSWSGADGGDNWRLLAAGFGLVAFFNFILFLRTVRLSLPAGGRLPRLVRFSYSVFTLILFTVGILLILQTPGIMPWPLLPETSVLIGWIFFGNGFYFLYAVLHPYWFSARSQLWSFLIYDLVLIGPLLGHLSRVQPELFTSLLVYLAILFYSGGLAFFYLYRDFAKRNSIKLSLQ